jgi:hypothetical protein
MTACLPSLIGAPARRKRKQGTARSPVPAGAAAMISEEEEKAG